jgi:hypothetical protein
MKNLASYLSRTLRRRTAPTLAIALALGLAVLCSTAIAQSGAGSIQGTVTDSTGAVVAGATVHIVNQATGVVTDAKSNGVGFYQAPELFTGTYVVTIVAPGMKTYNRTVDLLVGQTYVADAALTAGAVTQQVEVSADAVQLVNTENGVITMTLENARINQLPLNGRNMVSLVAETTPGMQSCPESSTCANGGEAPSIEFEVDGASLSNRQFGGVNSGQSQMVDPDAVQETTIVDNAASVQYALPATVVLSTKSGTNKIHGSFFETARNNDFGIARTRNEASTYAQPEYIRNEFGLSAGGPIILPHIYHGKDKSFWFFAYERYSLAQVAEQNSYVPTAAMRNGDFSGLVNSSNVLQQLYDSNSTTSSAACAQPAADGTTTPIPNAYCRTPFGGNASLGTTSNYINSNRESPTAAILNAITPMPTNSNNPLVSSNLVANLPELSVEPQITFRLDHNFTDSNKVYLRYTQNQTKTTSPRNNAPGPTANAPYTLADKAAGIPAGASGITFTPFNTFATAFGYTHVFSSTFYSELVLSDTWMSQHNLAGGDPGLDYESTLGLPNNFGEAGFPEINQVLNGIDGTQFQYGISWSIPQIDENLTKVVGRHQFQFGGRYRYEQFITRPDQSADDIQFSGQGTGLYNPTTSTAYGSYSNTGQLNADYYIGAAYNYSVNLQPPLQHIHDMEIDGYFQDNYRVRNNLTLNLGLRWEGHPASYMAQGLMTGFDIKNHAIVTTAPITKLITEGFTTQAIIANDESNGVVFETPSQAGLPQMLTYNFYRNFEPRVGAAWEPFGKRGTVIRGAIGRYIYPEPIREMDLKVDKQNPFQTGYSVNYESTQFAPLTNYMLLAPQNTSAGFNYNTTNASTGSGTPVMGTNSSNVVNTATTTAIPPGLSVTSLSPDYAPTYTDEADLTVEQPVKWNSAVRLSYVYTRGGNLNNYMYYNNHPSQYSWEIQQGAELPNSSSIGPTNTTTGEGPYDNTIYAGSSFEIEKVGWSNYNALQAVWQKLYNHGSAWQVMYTYSKLLRTGGDYGGVAGDYINPYANYVNTYQGNWVNAGSNTVTVGPANSVSAMPGTPNLPPPPPAGVPAWGYYKALNRWENYMVDTHDPPQHIQFNGIYDLPFGRGKQFLSGVNKLLDEAVGGWQIAGAGSFTVNNFQITSTNWGPTSPLHIYKKAAPITDCRSGNCVKSYEWWNGYIAPTAISGNTCSTGLTATVSGLPSAWKPYQTPMDTSCSAPSAGKTVVDKYYGANDVAMSGVTGLGKTGEAPQANGTVIGYGVVPGNNDNGSGGGAIDVTNPYGHTVLNGPMLWEADASLFKVFPIGEGIDIRLNFDAFNVFNHQGIPNPSGSDGTVCVTPGALGCSSANTGRQLQFSGRFTF